MKKTRTIIIILLCVAVAASALVLCANRYRFPEKIDTESKLYEILGLSLSADKITEEYCNTYTVDGTPYTSLVYKTNHSFADFLKITDALGEKAHTVENPTGVIRAINETLPAEKSIDKSSVAECGCIYKTYEYEYLPAVSSFITQYNVYWILVNRGNEEFVYINTDTPGTYKSLMISLSADTSKIENDTAETEEYDNTITIQNEYAPVIEDFCSLIEYRLSDDFGTDTEYTLANEILNKYKPDEAIVDFDYHFSCMLIDLPDYASDSPSDYGYVTEDINNDGITELFWTNSRKDFIYAVFTVKNEKAVMLDAFWPRYRCNVYNGMIITSGSGGAEITEYSAMKIDCAEAGCLDIVSTFGTDNGSYYSKTDGIETVIDETEYNFLTEKYPFEFDNTGLKNEVVFL